MKKNISIVVATILLATASCKENSKNSTNPSENKPVAVNIQNAGWLLGNWGNTLPNGSFIEKWTKENDSVYKAESYFIANNDTLFAEYITLGKVNDTIAYTVTVPNQNDEKPVKFKLTSMSDNKMVFENPQHNYPSKIQYTKVTTDSIVAVISGAKKGKQASETFAMARLK